MSVLKLQEIRMQWGVRIPMRDGIELSATVYAPRNPTAPSPALFTLTPYVAQSSHDTAVYFAARNYPFLTIDVRGRGGSGGVFKANGNEAKDAHDIVEWLARQPYCNGQVAMWGGSYAGYVQWAAARELPPSLVTIAPAAAPFRGFDSPAPGNIFAPYRVQWLNLLAGRTAQEKVFADQRFWNAQFCYWFQSGRSFRRLDTELGNPSAVFQEWLQHPQPDEYWDSYNPTPQQYAKIVMPVLTITGAYDTNQLGALKHYREHVSACAQARQRHYLVIGPWDHAGTRMPKAEFGGLCVGKPSLLDLGQLHLDWYAWTMQGGPKPEFLRKNVAYYITGSEKWSYADMLDEIGRESLTLYLGAGTKVMDVLSSGVLTAEIQSAVDDDHYLYDPRDVRLAQLESETDPASLVDQRMLHARSGKQLIYESAPFDTDIEISGFFRLSLWLSIDQPDTDFRVSVHEVAMDGSSLRLSSDCMRARYRQGLRAEHLVTTNEPLRYDFDRFTFVARQVRKGRRLRLVIGPVDSIFYEKNYNSGGRVCDETIADARPVTVRLFRDELHPSALYVPIHSSDET